MTRRLSQQAVFYLLLTATLIVRFFPFGARYFAYMDDYAAYGILHYLLKEQSPFSLYAHYGLHTARPLAGVLDVWLIAPLWAHLWVVLAFFVLLHAATLPLVNAVFKRLGLPHGRMLAVVLGLYPLLNESVYWVNAAARIVPGFLLLMAAAYGLCRFFEDQKRRWLALLVVCGVGSLGFYEQTICLGFALLCIVVYRYRRPWPWYALPLGYAGLAAGWYAVFLQAGRMGARAAQAGLSPGTFGRIGTLLVKEQLYNAGSLTLIELPRLSPALAVLCAVLAVSLCFFLKQKDKPARHGLYTVVCAALLFFAAFGPFFVLRDSFLSLRSLYFCLPVVALLCQWAWDGLARFRLAYPLAGLAIAGCLLLGVGSVNAFRVNQADDVYIAHQIVDILYDGGDPSRFDRVALFGARYQYTRHGGVHLQSATLTDWSLSALVSTMEFERFGQRYTLPDGSLFISPYMPAYENDALPPDVLTLTIDEAAAVRVVP